MLVSPAIPVWPLTGAALLVGALALAVLRLDAGFLQQMVLHILIMGVVAPLSALSLQQLPAGRRLVGARTLAAATGAQIAVLYFWHLPVPHAAAEGSALVTAAMHSSLALAALWFWLAVLARRDIWPAVAALLVTGKLFCLLGMLLVLARRPLLHGGAAVFDLREQQLAGLLMLAACPLTYVGVAFALTCLGIPREIGRPGRRHEPT
jgi:putative membrane protein